MRGRKHGDDTGGGAPFAPRTFPGGPTDAVKPTSAHSALTTIANDGKEMKILRDNMPFGRASLAEFGTCFRSYSRSPLTREQMLENMFVGRPRGNHERRPRLQPPVTRVL